jgi:predicted transport protein
MPASYVKPEHINLKSHAEFSERWVQDIIADDPAILGLGDLAVLDRERIQPRAGRLDLLLQDIDTRHRYEVELQLGATDEAHIIRAIEYWDIERRRYPQYEHSAVIVAEDITSRFLNIIALFNGQVPLIAIQMRAVSIGETVSLIFTKVVDEFSRGLVGQDEEAEAAPADRDYWEKRASAKSLGLVDEFLERLKSIDPSLCLNYNKHYVGLTRAGQPFNFVYIQPRKAHIRLMIRVPQSEEIDRELTERDLDWEFNSRDCYRVRVAGEDLRTNVDLLLSLAAQAYKARGGE